MAFTGSVDAIVGANTNGLLGKHPDWPRLPLADLARVQNGAAFKSAQFNSEGRGMPLLRIRDVMRGATDTWYEGDYDAAYIVRRGDLVIGMDGDFNHALWSGPDALLNQRVCRLVWREDAPVLKEFAFYALGGYLEAINAATPSVTVKHLSSKTVGQIPLPAPPIDEQRRIIQYVEASNEAIDAGVSAIASAERATGQLRSRYLADLALPDAPMTTIGEVAEVFVGATPPRSDPSLWGGEIPWVSSGEVAFCRITDTRETITEAGLGSRETRLHPAGTVLLAMIGEGKTRGQAALLGVPAAHNQNSAAIRPDRTRLLSEFLYYWLVRQYENTRDAGSGSQQPALNGKRVRAIELPLPSLDAQRLIVARLERRLESLASLEEELAPPRAAARILRRSVLRDLVTGKRGTSEIAAATSG